MNFIYIIDFNKIKWSEYEIAIASVIKILKEIKRHDLLNLISMQIDDFVNINDNNSQLWKK